jgi:hypothetical protein
VRPAHPVRPAVPAYRHALPLPVDPADDVGRAVAVLAEVRRVWGPRRPPPGEAEGRMASILERARARAEGQRG